MALAVGCVGPANVGALVPPQTQPEEVGEHGLGKIHPVARRVEVVVAQDEGAALTERPAGRDPERAGVPEMEIARRGGGNPSAVAWGRAQEFGFISWRRAPSWQAFP